MSGQDTDSKMRGRSLEEHLWEPVYSQTDTLHSKVNALCGPESHDPPLNAFSKSAISISVYIRDGEGDVVHKAPVIFLRN